MLTHVNKEILFIVISQFMVKYYYTIYFSVSFQVGVYKMEMSFQFNCQ